jgi:predicted short-subunit dehydrogenase-like oxidoreductase (DUF2520 family)
VDEQRRQPLDDGVSARPARLAVGVVGAGRVGSVLGAALARAGHSVVAASGVSDASRRRVAELLPGVPLAAPPDVVAAADLVLLTVPDDALPSLVDGLATTESIKAGQILIHTSGRYGAAAIHPVMTFTGTPVDLDRLVGCSFGVTAPAPLRPMAEALVVECGGEPEWIEESRRPLYHAALATGANHMVTLVAQASDLLHRAGVEHPNRMLGPLLGAALDNALRYGDHALTGPVARGDAGTVAAHIRELAQVSSEARAAYVAMSRLTADRALAAGILSAADAEALLDVLADRSDGARA